MNMWIIAAVIVGMLAISGIAIANFGSAEDKPVVCSSCGNSCTKDSNCGLATCGAVNGQSCSCNKK